MQSTKSRFSSIKIALWVVVLFQLSDVSAQQCYDAAVPMCGAYGNPLSFEQYQNSCVDEKNAYYEITCKKAKYEKQPDGMWYCMIPYHKRTNMGSYWSDDDLERGTLATCPPNGNYVLNQTNGHCERVPSCPSPTDLPQQCNRKDLQDGKITLHPIIPINGEKFRQEIDISLPSPHAIIFERNYRSGRVGASSFGKLNSTSVSFSSTTTDSSGNSSTTVVPGDTEIDFATGISYPEELVNGSIYQNRALSSLGQGWSTNLISRLSITQSTYQGILPPNYPLGWVSIDLGSGNYRRFKPDSSGWAPVGESLGKFWSESPDGIKSINTRYYFQDKDSEDVYVYAFSPSDTVNPSRANTAYLKQIKHRNGWITNFALDPASPVDWPRPASVTNAFGHKLSFTYSDNVSSIVTQVRKINPAGVQTAQVDFLYDTKKRLIEIFYSDGTSKSFHYEDAKNSKWLTGYSLNGSRIDTYVYDSAGKSIESRRANNVDRFTVDYAGTEKDDRYDTNTRATITDPLGTSRVFRYSAAGTGANVTYASAPPFDPESPAIWARSVDGNGNVTAESSFGPWSRSLSYDNLRQLPIQITDSGGARARSIAWHPNFRLPAQIDETGGKRTSFVYDDKGNLLQKTITDTTGTLVNEIWKWTYNAAGLVETETDPRDSVTTYAYDGIGQLVSKTNQLGHVTTYAYDATGNLSQITEPTGLVRTLTYTPAAGWRPRPTPWELSLWPPRTPTLRTVRSRLRPCPRATPSPTPTTPPCATPAGATTAARARSTR